MLFTLYNNLFGSYFNTRLCMYNKKKIVAFIPARGGSKGIKDKNLYPLHGHPLIYYTLKEAVASSYIDEIVVSTDSTEIANYCKSTEFPCTIVKRPAEISTDTSKTIEAVMHTIETLNKQEKEFDYLLILQPTSPLRQSFQIQGIIAECVDKNRIGMISVHEISYNPILMRYANDEMQVTKILQNQTSTVRRQDMKKVYCVDGMLYIYKINSLTNETSLNDIPYGYKIDPQYAIDINMLPDIIACEKLIQTLPQD